ncbi:MAG: DinB family protein [Bacteroidota bacterium]
MKLFITGSLMFILASCTQRSGADLTRTILLEEIANNHTTKDWYVPLGIAVEGLTAEQADWKDSVDNHSIRELLSHVAFWNERVLRVVQGEVVTDFNGDNETTFRKFDDLDWNLAVKKADSIQMEWQQAVERATAQQLDSVGSEISNMCSHTAYHTGQIVYIRKQNGWWTSAQGVK